MLSQPLSNFEKQNYYQNEWKFIVIYSRNNLPKIKHGTYVINLDEYKSIGSHRIVFYVDRNNATYFESFGVENVPEETEKFIGYKNIMTNFYGIQAYTSIMFWYVSIGLLILW